MLGHREKLFAQLISPVSILSAYKIWEMQCKRNIFKFGVEWRGVEKCAFSTENWSYLGNGERYGQCCYWSLIAKSHTPSYEMKIIDLGWPWRSVLQLNCIGCNASSIATAGLSGLVLEGECSTKVYFQGRVRTFSNSWKIESIWITVKSAGLCIIWFCDSQRMKSDAQIHDMKRGSWNHSTLKK